ncbi:hypothetical protein EGW08_019407 [Elysia chlorotica]|uniref:Uncharacterized protein n=1 Tax=Elysia chlorotica TaxID=188477 RepID=A0A3S0Z9V2_ELYCH|nr:hypothetical protein EGW08_019407 [Elysia chlorotica]
MSGLAGKSVIVTGSSSGIGHATALIFARKGCNVTVCGRDASRVQDTLEQCKQEAASGGHKGSKFISVCGDLTDPMVRTAVLEQTLQAFGSIDVVVSNHAVAVAGDTVETLTEDGFDRTISTNLKSGLFLVQKAIPHLEKSKGCVVFVSSIATSCCTKKGLFAYSFAKAGLEHMVRLMSLDLGPKGIRVNCVSPTLVKTRIFRELFPDPAHLDAFGSLYQQATPLNTSPSTAEDPAQAIVFLASTDARLISGASLRVDGALMCKGNPPNFV